MAADEAVEEKSRRRRKGREEEIEEEVDVEGEERGLTEGKGKITPGRRNREASKDSGGNFIVRSWRGIRGYFEGVRDELDKVVWPTREELIRLSRIVIMVTLACAAILGLFSFLFTELFVLGFKDSWIFFAFGAGVLVLYLYVTHIYLKGNDTPRY